uniref:Telomerase reverse transcriptase n=1 Tax=Acrobeloides nanus TaxID=290746 RepID=A0A914BXM4_9BILA
MSTVKKRERRKQFRKKYTLKCHETTFKNFKRTWILPEGNQLYYWKRPRFWNKDQMDQLAENEPGKIAEEIISKSCYDTIIEHPSRNFIDEMGVHLKRKFKSFRLERVLNGHIPKNMGLSVPQLIERRITFGQLYAVLKSVFKHNFSEDLLGNFWPAFLKCVVHSLFDAKPKGAIANPENFFDGFKMSEIKWLRNLPSGLQFAIIQNVFLYLCVFAINIICHAFFLARTSDGQITMYRRDVWNQIEDYGFKLVVMQRRLKLHPLPPEKFEKLPRKAPIHRLTFIPKNRDVRPIVTFKNPQFSTILSEIKAILDLIIGENSHIFGLGLKSLSSFPFKYKRFILHSKKFAKEENFWCTGDMANCFTSMDHAILENVLSQFISKAREFIVVRYFVRVTAEDGTQKNFRTFVAGKNLADAKHNLYLRYNTTLASNPSFSTYTGHQIINRIKCLVLKTPIKHGSKLYIAERGIAQGNVLSVKLCNIYLGAMERHAFPNGIPRNIICSCRYVDDYFIVSKKKNLIEQMIQKLNAGAEIFRVQMNTSKTILSFKSTIPKFKFLKQLRKKKRLPWCGYAFNTKTLTMSLDYARYKNRHPKSAIPRQLGKVPTKLVWIQKAIKKLLMPRVTALRCCAKPFLVQRRKQIRRRFLGFAMDFYIRYFSRILRLNISKRFAQCYTKKLLKWIVKGLKKKFAPSIDKFL